MPKVEQFPYVITEGEQTRIADTPKQQGNDNVPLHSVMFQQVELTIERSWTGGNSVGFSFEEDVPMDNGYKIIWNMKSEWDSQANKFLSYKARDGQEGTPSDALTWVEGDKVKVALSRRDFWHKKNQESTPKGVIAFGRKVGSGDARPSEDAPAPVAARPSASSTKTSILKGMGFNNVSAIVAAALASEDVGMEEQFMPLWKEALVHAMKGEEVFQSDDPEALAWLEKQEANFVPKEQGTLEDLLNAAVPTDNDVFNNEEVVDLADVPVAPTIEKDYKVEAKSMMVNHFGLDHSDEALAWMKESVGEEEDHANSQAYWFATYLKAQKL